MIKNSFSTLDILFDIIFKIQENVMFKVFRNFKKLKYMNDSQVAGKV